MAHLPERTCVVCRIKKPKNELFRFLVGKNGGIELDREGKKLGRGFYICSAECWDGAVAKKRKIRIGSDAKKATSVSLPEKSFEQMVTKS